MYSLTSVFLIWTCRLMIVGELNSKLFFICLPEQHSSWISKIRNVADVFLDENSNWTCSRVWVVDTWGFESALSALEGCFQKSFSRLVRSQTLNFSLVLFNVSLDIIVCSLACFFPWRSVSIVHSKEIALINKFLHDAVRILALSFLGSISHLECANHFNIS